VFHHFDPPWAGNYVHNPDGMIALCPEHHLQADGGSWTKAQLRDFKKHPYIDDVLRIPWPWRPETLVMKVGRSLVVGSGSPIRLDGLPVMRFYPGTIPGLEARTILFESDIRDEEKRRWFRVTDGWFDLRLEHTTDVKFTPQTKTISAVHNDQTYVSLEFRKYSAQQFQNWAAEFIDKKDMIAGLHETLRRRSAIDTDGFVPVVIVEGRFRTRKISIHISGDIMHFQSFIPGLKEEFDWHSWIVDDAHRAILRLKDGGEFFSLG
jgi:hypothetical protein